jgi:hypothetical protein
LLPTLEPSVLCEGSVGIGKVSDGFRVGARFQRARGHLARRVPITLGAVEVFLRDGMKSDPPEPGEPSSSAASGPRRTARPPTGGVRGNRITSAHTPRFAGSVSSARRGELHFVEERATAGGRDADPTAALLRNRLALVGRNWSSPSTGPTTGLRACSFSVEDTRFAAPCVLAGQTSSTRRNRLRSAISAESRTANRSFV